MSYITKSLTIIITLLALVNCAPYSYSNYYPKRYTRNIKLKQGDLQGIVVEPRVNRALPLVELFLGLPYAAPPVGDLRFMPSGSAPSWTGTRYADNFGPVCPQKFPDESRMTHERKDYFARLKEYLMNESEDCLYLNIYAPHQDPERSARKYPVMVFIHGESFEWNSGNPYDGSVLAGYGKVIVVTLNFRLGILGFLKAGTEALSESNFGLVDQIAALLWVKENIAAFGGDPSAVTLFGHGTGAVCASLLMLSPIVQQDGNRLLFQRAILMGGTALADWALAGNARDVTYQVAQALNCQIQDDFAACLRRKRLDDIKSASAKTPNYTTPFGPIVDSVVVPSDPKKSMTQYSDIFRRFELMYGVTELESINLLGPVELAHGMLEKERDEELRNYLRTRCEMKPELCLARTLAEYTNSEFAPNDEKYARLRGLDPDAAPDRASIARDALLDILSDARSVAPIVQTARYHAALNLQSYFYVFTHKTTSKDYIRDKSYNGEELPYVFGVPLDGPRNHFVDQYTKHERLFSEIIMMYFSNFAYTGNPNNPRKQEFYTLSPVDWFQFDVEWPEFDPKQERYLQLDIPPNVYSHYRRNATRYWNEILPQLIENRTYLPPSVPNKKPTTFFTPPRNPPPWILQPRKNDYENFNKRYETPKDSYGILRVDAPKERYPDNLLHNKNEYGTILTAPPEEVKQASTMNVLLIIGGLFLVANLILFIGLYYKCYRIKKNSNQANKSADEPQQVEVDEEKAPNPESDTAFKGNKFKLSRQMSSSTIDAHTKVKDWITNEIVYKYSPRFFHNRHNKEDASTPSGPEEKVRPPPLIKMSTLSKKPEKVSVAIDATPTGRGPSVLMQQPIELTKSLDCPSSLKPERLPLRRSITLEDFSPRMDAADLRKSTTSINLKFTSPQLTEIGQPDLYSAVRKFKTFGDDVNVTSKDAEDHVPLSPEEALMTIKRRNFPKVLPDHPGKRMSMPAHGLFMPIPEISSFSQPNSPVNKSLNKFPPAPPPRISSTLGRQGSTSSAPSPACISEPQLAEEPPSSPEPEISCNNLYVGPLIPKCNNAPVQLDTQPIYESLRNLRKECGLPKAAKGPIKRMDAKIVVKPTISRKISDPVANKNIPRVVVPDNQPQLLLKVEKTEECNDSQHNLNVLKGKGKKSQIPTLVKNSNTSLNKDSSSSESSPSEESDTGTVVKRV